MDNELPSPKLGEGAQRAGEVCFLVYRQPSTVDRQPTTYPSAYGTSPNLGEEFTLSALSALPCPSLPFLALPCPSLPFLPFLPFLLFLLFLPLRWQRRQIILKKKFIFFTLSQPFNCQLKGWALYLFL